MPCLVVGGRNITKVTRVNSVTREAIVEEDKTLMCGEFHSLSFLSEICWEFLKAYIEMDYI